MTDNLYKLNEATRLIAEVLEDLRKYIPDLNRVKAEKLDLLRQILAER